MSTNFRVTSSEAITQCLIREGIDTVFGIPGGYLSSLLDAFARAGIRSIEARHEAAAAYMAAGYAQASGKIGVVYAQSGPGVLNAITGVASAFMDSTPLLLIGGQCRRDNFGGEGHQEATGFDLGVDQMRAMRGATHYAVRPGVASTIPRLVRSALTAARRMRGPAMLDVPVDLLGEPIDFEDLEPASYRANSAAFDPRDVDQIADMLRSAARPVILAGNRITHIGAGDALTALCSEQEIPCVTVSNAKGALVEDHPLSVGVLGRAGQRGAIDALRNADLLLCIGARLSHLTTFHNPELFKNVVQIDIDEREIGRTMPVRYGAVGDLGAFVTALRAASPKAKPSRDGRAWVQKLRKEFSIYDHPDSRVDTNPITPPRALRVLRENLPREALIVGDTGTVAVSVGRHLPVYSQDGYFSLYGLASMGSGLPMAHGVQAARPDAMVVSVHGDGAFLAHTAELGVAVQNKLPVIHVVLNNNQYKSISERQVRIFQRRYATTILNPDSVQVARGFGCEGYSVGTAADLATAVRAAVPSRRPTVIEVKVDENYTEEHYLELAAFEDRTMPQSSSSWPFAK